MSLFKTLLKIIKNNQEIIFSFLVYLLTFLYLIYPYYDFDWGWHYRYGEYLIKHHQILQKDIFSWTLPGYSWTNHSWLYDPFFYLIFNKFGFTGLIIAGAVITFAIFYILIRNFKLTYWQKMLIAIFYITITYNVFYMGLRSQLTGLLFLAILMSILARINNKNILFIPFIFLIWANMHGSFLIGLGLFAIYIIFSYISFFIGTGNTKQISDFNIKKILTVFTASLGLTFVNPFTYEVYLEGFKHFDNPFLKYVNEWKPLDISDYGIILILIIYFLLLASFFILRRKIKDLPYIIISILLFYLSLTSKRYTAIFVIATIPVFALMLSESQKILSRFNSAKFIFLILLIAGFEIVLPTLSSEKLFGYSYYDYCNNAGCSEKLTQFILKNPPKGHGFNIYNWGGYLIGRGIKTKLFIDGRMHLWEQNEYMPFSDFYNIYYNGDLQLFNKYDFDWVILETKSSLDDEINSGSLGSWRLEYSDNTASYYIREK